MWKLLVCINSIKCMIQNRCLFCPLIFEMYTRKTGTKRKLIYIHYMMAQFHCHIRFCPKIGPIEMLFSKFNEVIKICLPGHMILIIYFVILVSEEYHYDKNLEESSQFIVKSMQ